jgi:carboxylesterase type B
MERVCDSSPLVHWTIQPRLTCSPRIRYAAPPLGDLRWKPAVTPSTNRTIAQADTFGPACPAVLPPGAPFLPGGSEDCLFLNVWAPEKAKNLPVLVWIHGGGYGAGDGTQDMTGILNDNGNSFVVVSIQYRVSVGFSRHRVRFADGFPSLEHSVFSPRTR